MLRRAFGSEKQVDPSDDDDRSRRLRYRCRATNVLTIVYLLSLLLIALALSLADAEKQRQSLAGAESLRRSESAVRPERLDASWPPAPQPPPAVASPQPLHQPPPTRRLAELRQSEPPSPPGRDGRGKRYGNPAIRLDIPWSEPKARFPATDRLKAADEEGSYDESEKLRIAKRIRKLREQRRKSDREARMNEDGDENSAYHYL